MVPLRADTQMPSAPLHVCFDIILATNRNIFFRKCCKLFCYLSYASVPPNLPLEALESAASQKTKHDLRQFSLIFPIL